MESFKQKPENYDSMSFGDLEQDPVAGSVLQQKALEYLKTEDKEYFEREFTGELDSEGYLIPKDESRDALTKPSMNIGGGKAMETVLEMTKAELKEGK